jgi:hypothetical protein
MRRLESDRLTKWNRTWALAAVFGLASIPWTYGFVAELEIPLWPAFIASATYFAADGGVNGLVRGYTSNVAGIVYGAATLALVDAFFGGSVTALSVTVGAFMFLASLHAFVPLLSFTPGTFFGYATLFSVEAAGATALGIAGLPGATLAAALSMFLGALIGLLTDRVSVRVS